MKYLIYILSACILVIILMTTTNAMGIRNVNKLTGYVESVFDGSITRTELASGKSQNIYRKNVNSLFWEFDISPDGKERVFPGFLQLYNSNDKKLKLINERKLAGIAPSFSPDGKSIAYLSFPNEKSSKNRIRENLPYLYTIKMDGSSEKQISKLPCQRSRPSWLPDGKQIVVGLKKDSGGIGSTKLGIYIIDIETGSQIKIINDGTTPTISHDGKKIVYLSEESGDGSVAVLIYDMETKKTKTIIEKLFTRSEWPLIWSPDDRYILYTDNKREHHEIHALNIETGERQKVISIQGVAMGWR